MPKGGAAVGKSSGWRAHPFGQSFGALGSRNAGSRSGQRQAHCWLILVLSKWKLLFGFSHFVCGSLGGAQHGVARRDTPRLCTPRRPQGSMRGPRCAGLDDAGFAWEDMRMAGFMSCSVCLRRVFLMSAAGIGCCF